VERVLGDGAVRLVGLIKRWLAAIDARGATAVEFALVGSVFMIMLLA
jgi:Flp pilus assembly protein TadG